MAVREKLLALLLEQPEKYFSGEELGRRLGVSRSAVWKAMGSLRAAGFAISGTTRRGYRLQEGDPLNAAAIRNRLTGPAGNIQVEVWPELDSTNNEAKRRLAAGLKEPLLLVAASQTQGRGRQGREFFSPAGGLYMSLVVHPHAELTGAIAITSAVAVGVCRAVEAMAPVKATIKWVNDIYVEGKKLCGILCEANSDFETNITESVIIGVGVNLGAPAFPTDLTGRATSLPLVRRGPLAAEIANRLLELTSDLRDRSYLAEYRSRSLVLGREIYYIRDNIRRAAVALDIDDQGGLVVEHEDGSRLTLSSGEISLRLADSTAS